MTKKQKEKNEWFVQFFKEYPGYKQIVDKATTKGVVVYREDESPERLWVIQVTDTAFWLDSKKTKKEAVSLCKKMRWKIHG